MFNDALLESEGGFLLDFLVKSLDALIHSVFCCHFGNSIGFDYAPNTCSSRKISTSDFSIYDYHARTFLLFVVVRKKGIH